MSIEPSDERPYAHLTRAADLMAALDTSEPVRALCGAQWVAGRSPAHFPACPTCRDVHSGPSATPERPAAIDTGAEGPPEAADIEGAVRAATWDEAVNECRDLGWLHEPAYRDALARNPYRKEGTS